MDDLIDGIVRLQHAFRKHQIEPAIVELSSWEDGQRLRSILAAEHRTMIELGMDQKTGEPRHQVTVAGTIIRWPVLRRAVRGGGFEYE